YLYSYSISFSLIKMSDYLKGNYFKTIFKTSIISLLVSLPITLYNFYEINILSIIYNLIFIPIISIIIFPMSLLVIIIKPLLPIYNYLIIGVERLSLFFSNISFGKLIFKRLPIYIYIIYFLLVMIYFYKPKKIFIYMFFSLLSIHYLIPYLNYSTYMEILDVGQGDSILIHSSNKVILMDTGGKDNSNGVIFFNTINPGLKSLGIKKIDYLILSHGDSDHMGEAINLVNNFKVDKVIFNCGSYNYLEKELIKDLEKKKIKYYSCINELNINKNKFYFLQTKEYDNENDNSNVIYTELNGYKFMFMGDASIYTEQEILNEYNLSNIDVLKVGHHGSKTSSSKEFIDVINPMYSIISVGEDNKYGHPNKEVLENLNNSKIYRTDQDGSIMFKIKNNKLYALLYNHM
ncbi:MAG: ComEC family DNA internalization-related competence protein, partial [Bacilli bacterium]|nr:ComEC family DNA internalization-related competence protein [Bacilli bacterium]